MDYVSIQCYADLSDFLPPSRRNTAFAVPWVERESIKNLIESQGVPHTEVEALLANGTPCDFSYLVQPGDQIAAYPASAVPEHARAVPLRPPISTLRFVLDTHLGRLAAYLRMLGFDTLYRNDYDDPELAWCSFSEERILLTRDLGLLKRGIVIHGYFVRETTPGRQIAEVMQRFGLRDSVMSFKRCIRCNGLMQPVDKHEISAQLAPKTRQFYDEFHRCQSCAQIYWRGSHYQHMQQFIERVLRAG